MATINEHVTEFMGKRVVTWEPPAEDGPAKPPDKKKRARRPTATGVYRIESDAYGPADGWLVKFKKFTETPLAAKTTGLVIGAWPGIYETGSGAKGSAGVVKALASARTKLPALRGIFLADVTYEEVEISWIAQTNLAPLLRAYPKLEHLRVRGGNGLSFGPLRLTKLKSLVIESGGLPASVVRQVGGARLPALEHLELWLGSKNYGGDSGPGDVKKLLASKGFPKLRYLGLRDCEWADALVPLVVDSPLLAKLHVLDLSLGVLTDTGAAALLKSSAVGALKKLKKIDLHHHYVSSWLIDRLKAEGYKLDASGFQIPEVYDGEIYRHVSVSE